MAATSPATVTRQQLAAGDETWVAHVEDWWHATAAAFEDTLDRWWTELQSEREEIETLARLFEGKVQLTAIGVNALLPPEQQLEESLSSDLPTELVADIVRGCYLPAAGHVAY